MSNSLYFAAAIAVAGFVGYLGLKHFNPEAAAELGAVADLLSGKMCTPDLQRPDVYMPKDERCQPVAVMLEAPSVRGERDAEATKNIVLTMVNPNALGKHRLVRVQRRYQPEDILPAGENLPSGSNESREVIKKWVSAQEQEACTLLPADFAATCSAMESRIQLSALSSGKPFIVEFALTYSSAQPIGPLPATGVPLVLHSEEPRIAQDMNQSLSARVKEATSKALERCSKLREQFGNCMVSLIVIEDTGNALIRMNWVAPAKAS
ncbi:hypothetical protein [Defluviimonas salinarum]|uniref:Uncharacterized protein n=1 Tax=Defluviimonas salinarum TaxID=2992147 RepID=A0ABT3IZ90_9RHOB|nr:hypothetical protein [Defluviimonas salinarum]MCW3780740.1 hypothetical protein [Defluviimonas salinarum]